MSCWPPVQVRHVARFRYGDSLPSDRRIDGVVPVYGSNGQVGTHAVANTGGPAIVVGRKGSYGKLQFSWDPVFAIDTTYIIDRSTTDSDVRWLYYALHTARLEELSQDVGVPGLNREDAYSQRISLPGPPEQRAIARFLDTETARIDALISKKRRMIDLLEEHWRNLVSHTMRALGAQYGEIALKRRVVCLDGRRVPLSAEERAGRSGIYPYFGASAQIDWVDDYLFDETLVLLGEDGAQLADPNCDISTVVSGRVWVNNHAHVLRPTGSDPWFLSMHLSTVDRAVVISGATREKITQSDMNEIPVPDVPLTEQVQISSKLRKRRTDVDTLSARLRRQIDLLQEHRQALITAAVTGELEVPGVAA